jgi:hypothetical protein
MAVRLSALRAGHHLHTPGRLLSRPQGHSAVGNIRSIEKSSDLIGTRTHDLLICSIVPQPTTLPRVPWIMNEHWELKYYVSGRYPSSFFFLFKNTTFRRLDSVSVFRLCPIDRASPYFRAPAPTHDI